MAVFKQANKIKKLEQSIKKYEFNNPKKAEKIKGKIEALRGRKS